MDGHMEDVARETILDAGAAEVWEELTDPERLGEWFGADVDGRVAQGEPLRFSWPDGTERRAVVERSDRERELVFRWLPADDDPSSRVAITIEEVPDGTALRVVETRIEAAVSPSPRIGFRPLARV
jgi:uncharacterized protein YndB with AHSA1/START domain